MIILPKENKICRSLFWLGLLSLLSCSYSRQVQIKKDSDQNKFDNQAFELAYYLGAKNKIKGDKLKAMEYFQNAIAINKRCHACYYQMSLLSESKYEALAHIQNALLINPNYNKWYIIQLAEVYEKNEKWDKATACYELLAKMESNDNESACQFKEAAAKNAVLNKNIKKAIQIYEGYQQECGLNKSIVKGMLLCFEYLGKKEKAIQTLYLWKKQNLNPANEMLLAQTFLSYGIPEEAEELSLKVLNIQEYKGDAALLLFKIKLQQKQYDALFEYARNIIEDTQISLQQKIQVLSQYTQLISLDNNHINNLLAVSKELCYSHPQQALSWMARADIYFDLQQKDSAWKYYQKAINLGENDLGLIHRFLDLCITLNKIEALLNCAQNMQVQYPNQVSLYIYEARAWLERRNFDKCLAITQMAQLYSVDKTSTMHVALIESRAFAEKELFQKAKENYENLLEQNPNNILVISELLRYLCVYEKNEKEAQNLNKKLSELVEDQEAPFVLYSQALYDFLRDNYEQALEKVDLALQKKQHWQYHMLKAKILNSKNLSEQSKIAEQNALNLATTEEIKTFIKDQIDNNE